MACTVQDHDPKHMETPMISATLFVLVVLVSILAYSVLKA